MKSKWLVVATAILQLALALSLGRTFAAATTMRSADSVGERVPSEDSILKDFHSLGLLDGRVDIFRCASPVRDLGTLTATTRQCEAQISAAKARIGRLHYLGIRTIVCLEDPENSETDNDAAGLAKAKQLKARLTIERAAAIEGGIDFIMMPMANSGPHSLENMSDVEVLNWLEQVTDEILKDAKTGGVIFHCSAGHDRTGMVAAFIRMKYEHWPVDQAIDEMRRYGHNWVKYSKNGGISSWHEDHLRAIAQMLNQGESK
jgi:protein-tyrosine phosphatase